MERTLIAVYSEVPTTYGNSGTMKTRARVQVTACSEARLHEFLYVVHEEPMA